MARPTYVRPFGPKAPWNIPVAGIKKHPESATYADRFYNNAGDRAGNFNIGGAAYSFPVYYTTDAITEFTVKGGNSTINGTKIPWNPAWSQSSGTDGQVIVLDPATGREWDLWQVKTSGTTITISNGSLIGEGESVGSSNRVGDYRTKENGWVPSRGVGIQYLAMLVQPEEISIGKIDHALCCGIANPSKTFYVAPATKLEHPGGEISNPIPEGMRFALNITDAQIESYVKSKPSKYAQFCRTVATALREYGWFITDTSGGCHFQIEDIHSAGDLWSALGLDVASNELRDILDGLITKDKIYTLVPSDQYGDVEPPAPVNKAPIVSAVGPSAAVKTNAVFNLQGVASDDGLPNPPGKLTYVWEKVSGPGKLTFSNALAMQTNAVADTQGNYVIKFTANDSALSSSASVSVVVEDVVTPPPPDTCEQELAAAKTQIAVLTSQVATLQSEVTTLTAQNKQLQADYATLQTSYTALNKQLQTLQADYNTLNTKYNALKTQMQKVIDTY